MVDFGLLASVHDQAAPFCPHKASKLASACPKRVARTLTTPVQPYHDSEGSVSPAGPPWEVSRRPSGWRLPYTSMRFLPPLLRRPLTLDHSCPNDWLLPPLPATLSLLVARKVWLLRAGFVRLPTKFSGNAQYLAGHGPASAQPSLIVEVLVCPIHMTQIMQDQLAL